jgi:DNA polymerase-3 subunit gamma/tau
MLSQQAFNAFLKTLEEPPAYAIFILATTEKHKILPTILSRCQIFDFNRIHVEDMANHLASIARRERIQYDQDGLHIIAQKADGGLRDALSMFDQIVSFSNKQVTYQAVIDNLNILDYDYFFKLTDAILIENPADTLLILNDILNNGFDGSHFISGLASHFRNLLVAKEAATLKLLEVSESIKAKYLDQAQKSSTGLLLSALNIANQCEINYKTSKNQRLQVELALLKICHLSSAIKLSQLGTLQLPTNGDYVKKKLPNVEQKPEIPVSESRSSLPVSDRNVAVNPVSTIATEPVKEYTKVPEVSNLPPKVKKGGWGSAKSSMPALPDLNSIFESKAVEEGDNEPSLVKGTEEEVVTHDKFLHVWNTLANEIKKENKINLYTLMTAVSPKILGNLIEVDVENMVQMDVLNVAKIDLLNYLRPALPNFSLDLRGVIMEHDVVRKPYTSQEKYQAMVQKNPLLETLRKELNLGLS